MAEFLELDLTLKAHPHICTALSQQKKIACTIFCNGTIQTRGIVTSYGALQLASVGKVRLGCHLE